MNDKSCLSKCSRDIGKVDGIGFEGIIVEALGGVSG